MNRLLSGEPREVIIYKIIHDGIYRHRNASSALSEYLHSEKDEAIVRYYEIMIENADALDDAYDEALKCSDANMKEVCRLLGEYFRIAGDIIDDTDGCKIPDEALEGLTNQAGDILKQAEEYSSKCLDIPKNPDGKM